MIKLGLTGSIGMGKTATAALFKAEGAPVYDADAAVHELYGVGGDAVAPVEAAFPGVAADGFVDRVKLSQAVFGEPSALKRLEAIVHPLVGRHRVDFFEQVRGAPVVVLDIPLLFETGGEKGVDAIAVVTAPLAVQRERVMQRPGMTAEKLDAILARQTPDADKRARADFVIDTSKGFALAKREVRSVLNHLADPLWWTARKRPLDEGRDASH